MRMMFSDVAKCLGLAWTQTDLELNGVSTDSRTVVPGNLFIALKGPTFDGNEFIGSAIAQGALAVIAEVAVASVASMQVVDSLEALARLSQCWHRKVGAATVAITGSMGKTSVKEMLASMLSTAGLTCTTKGNFNNAIGLPLTLLSETLQDQYAVIEMGANSAGEIRALARIVQPEIGIITGIAPAHLEGFGSVDGVIRAKAELFQELPENGTAVISIDCVGRDDILRLNRAQRVLTVSATGDVTADIFADNIHTVESHLCFDFHGLVSGQITLRLLGLHNINNCLLALAAAYILGIDVPRAAAAVAEVELPGGRLKTRLSRRGARVIDDSYNANPASVRAAIDWLGSQPGPRYLVMGDMGELGREARSLHRDCGRYAQNAGLDGVFTVGVLSREMSAVVDGGKHFSSLEVLGQYLRSIAVAEATLLVKGSRAAHMERVVNVLVDNNNHGDHL